MNSLINEIHSLSHLIFHFSYYLLIDSVNQLIKPFTHSTNIAVPACEVLGRNLSKKSTFCSRLSSHCPGIIGKSEALSRHSHFQLGVCACACMCMLSLQAYLIFCQVDL